MRRHRAVTATRPMLAAGLPLSGSNGLADPVGGARHACRRKGVTGGRRPHPSDASALPPSSFRIGLTRGEDAVDVATWAGSVPAVTGVSPQIRSSRKWFDLLWLLRIGLVVLLRLVAAPKGLRNMPSAQCKEGK